MIDDAPGPKCSGVFFIIQKGGVEMIIFVYGTLKKKYGNNFRLKDCPFLGEKVLTDIGLYDLGPFPMAIWQEGAKVVCEAYECSPEVVHGLDALEGHPYFYERTPVNSDGLRGYVYLGKKEQVKGKFFIEKGIWERS